MAVEGWYTKRGLAPQVERHLKRLNISAELILECLLGKRDDIVVEGLPDGVQILAVTYLWDYACFSFVIKHESFEEIPTCELLPELNVTVRLKTTEEKYAKETLVQNPFYKKES